MGQRGNPYMVKGHKLNVGRTPANKKRSLTQMLAQFTPRVMEIIEARLHGDEADQWLMAKELMPYLFPKQAPLAVPQASPQETVDLKTYMLERVRHGIEKPA
jgi:hypothetical protein